MWSVCKENRKLKHVDGLFNEQLKSKTAMQQAIEIQQRAATVGFDWTRLEPVMDKVREELDEVAVEISAKKVHIERVEEEVGDLLFAVLNLARHIKVDPEQALLLANKKFIKRFQLIEAAVQHGSGSFNDYSLEELEAFWQQAKQKR